MTFTLLLKLVFKNMLLRKLRFSFTLLAAGIAVGSTLFLFSLGYGLESVSTEQLVKADALSQVEASSDRPTEVNLNSEMVSQIENLPEVAEVASSTSLAGKLKIDNSTLDSPFYAASVNFYPMAQLTLASGRFPKDEEKDYLILSEKTVSIFGGTNENILGRKLKYSLIIPPTLGKGDGQLEFEGTVIGVITGTKSSLAYISEANAKQAGALKFSILKIKVNDKNDITILRKKVENLGLKTVYVGDTLAEMNRFFNYFRFILAGFGMIGVIIALLGMFNTLTVSLMERIKEVSLLKILGSKEKTIFWLFAMESLIFGVLGYALGLIIFLLVKLAIVGFLANLAHRLGSVSVDIFKTPATLLIVVFLATTLLAYLTGLFPARRALKVNPLDVQRYE